MEKLSLVHLARQPLVKGGSPPLLLLLHGVGSNEYDLFELAPYLDKRFLIISARAPNTLGRDSYAWFEVSFTRLYGGGRKNIPQPKPYFQSRVTGMTS